MADFLKKQRDAAQARINEQQNRLALERAKRSRLTERLDMGIPDHSSMLEAILLAHKKYPGQRDGIQRAEKELEALRNAGPDENGVLGGIALDEEFEE